MTETTEEQISILDYFKILVRWRQMIVKGVVILTLLTTVFVFLLPERYTAQTTLLPPEEQSSMPGISALLMNTDIPMGGFGLPEFSSNSELFVKILNSRNINEKIIDRFNLMEIYDARSKREALEALEDNFFAHVEEASVISIQVTASTPELAADMANAFVEELDHFNRINNITAAKNTRMFVEQRLEEAKTDLTRALKDLQRFQEKHQLISLTDQAKVAVESAASLEGQIHLLDIQLAVQQRTLHTTHPEAIQTRIQIEEIRKQLNKIRTGDTSPGSAAQDSRGTVDFNLPFSRIPNLQLQLGQLMMEVKIQESLVQLLQQQFEQAKIQEVRDTPTVQCLDTAIPPDEPSEPNRILIIGVVLVVSFALSVMLAFVREYGRRLVQDSVESRKLEEITSMLLKDSTLFKRLFTDKSPNNGPSSSSRPERVKSVGGEGS